MKSADVLGLPRMNGVEPLLGLLPATAREEPSHYETAQRLAAIVESSDDAIVSKDFDGIITSWNRGAERLFGYTAEEAIGQPITILIPQDRHDEEPAILARIRSGERVDHYETVRQRKDGALIEISLSVSPIRGPDGRIIGASKIARDITERRRAQEQQQLLLREMNHRVKNLFALASGVVALSARSARTAPELAAAVQERLEALSRAHALAITRPSDGGGADQPATLHSLVHAIVTPHQALADAERPRISLSGSDLPIAGPAVSALALLLHEFATNAAKYGALSSPTGRIRIECNRQDERFVLTWIERGGPRIEGPPEAEGFGSLLARAAVQGQLGGVITRHWEPEGLTIQLVVDSAVAGGNCA
jgi:PAS domain S-box-containing protein